MVFAFGYFWLIFISAESTKKGQISLQICTVWTGSLLYFGMVYSNQYFGERTAKALIRLHKFAEWSEHFLSTCALKTYFSKGQNFFLSFTDYFHEFICRNVKVNFILITLELGNEKRDFGAKGNSKSFDQPVHLHRPFQFIAIS